MSAYPESPGARFDVGRGGGGLCGLAGLAGWVDGRTDGWMDGRTDGTWGGGEEGRLARGLAVKLSPPAESDCDFARVFLGKKKITGDILAAGGEGGREPGDGGASPRCSALKQLIWKKKYCNCQRQAT